MATTTAQPARVEADRAVVLYSATWHPLPFRVVIRGTAVLHSDDREAARAFARRYNSCPPVEVLRR